MKKLNYFKLSLLVIVVLVLVATLIGCEYQPEPKEIKEVKIVGEAITKSTLTAKMVDPPNATVKYTWLISNAKLGEYTPIEGATNSSTYKVGQSDIGKFIKVRVTGIGNFKCTVESEPTDKIEDSILNLLTALGLDEDNIEVDENNGTITILVDFIINEDTTVEIPSGLTMIINEDVNVQIGGGKALTVDGNLLLEGDRTIAESLIVKGDLISEGSLTVNKDLTVENDLIVNDDLTINSGTTKVKGSVISDGEVVVKNGATLDLTEGSLKANNTIIDGELLGFEAVDFSDGRTLTVTANTATIKSSGTDIRWYTLTNAKAVYSDKGSGVQLDFNEIQATAKVVPTNIVTVPDEIIIVNSGVTFETNKKTTIKDATSVYIKQDAKLIGTANNLSVKGYIEIDSSGELAITGNWFDILENGQVYVKPEGKATVNGVKFSIEDGSTWQVDDNTTMIFTKDKNVAISSTQASLIKTTVTTLSASSYIITLSDNLSLTLEKNLTLTGRPLILRGNSHIIVSLEHELKLAEWYGYHVFDDAYIEVLSEAEVHILGSKWVGSNGNFIMNNKAKIRLEKDNTFRLMKVAVDAKVDLKVSDILLRSPLIIEEGVTLTMSNGKNLTLDNGSATLKNYGNIEVTAGSEIIKPEEGGSYCGNTPTGDGTWPNKGTPWPDCNGDE